MINTGEARTTHVTPQLSVVRISTQMTKRGDVKRFPNRNGIYSAQIQALYQQTPVVLTVNMVNAALVAIVLASCRAQIDWLIFLALNVALTAVRTVGWVRYQRREEAAANPSKWALCATLGSGLSGLLWGASSAFLLPDNLVGQTFVAFVIGGICAASLVSFSDYLPAFVAYVFPASLPLAGRFFLDGWTVHGDMVVVFAVAITLAAYNSTRAFSNGLRLNFALTEKTRQLAATNHRLETEITQRRDAEEQLRQAQKMEAIGQLTGGIAHDFNNLLTAIVGHLEMAESRLAIQSPIVPLLQRALRAAERGAALTRHLLVFARRQHLDPRSVDIPAVIGGAEEMLNQTIGPEIRLVICADANVHPAWIDPNQLELAILNLALNARDAMPAGGTLQIDAENRRADADNLTPDLPPGDYVVVSVSDNGTGMSQETLARAFEPFFTTKEAGCGCGLGLSIVHGFAAQSGGSVRIASTLSKGTRVDLWLPRANGDPAKVADVPPEGSIPELSQARILVCDDDADVLAFVGAILRDSGFTVWEADSPQLALDILEQEKPLDLLLVDYAMPVMNGIAVIDRARALQQRLNVILMSGHAEVLHAGEVAGVSVLVKPFRIAELRRQIVELLVLSPRAPRTEKSEPLLAVAK